MMAEGRRDETALSWSESYFGCTASLLTVICGGFKKNWLNGSGDGGGLKIMISKLSVSSSI